MKYLLEIVKSDKEKVLFIKNILKILIIVILVEIFIFNFNSYKNLFEKNEYEFTKEDFSVYEKREDSIYVEIDNISTEIKTLYISMNPTIDVVEYQFLYTDDTSSEFRSLPSKTYVQNIESSKYISTYLSGTSNKIGLIISDPNVDIISIGINKNIPFNFNLIRVSILFLSILFIYSLKKLKIFQVPFSNYDYKQEWVLLIIFLIFCCTACYINNYSQSADMDYYSYNFVDSLSKGKISLEEIPNENLIALDNPYDYTERNEAGLIRDVDYIWDVALYDGNYYVYFGILPAIILLVPFHIITGGYLSVNIAILIFSILTAYSLKELIKNIFDKFFKDIPFKYMIYSLLILLFGSQILVLNGTPRFYELAIISGLFFAITGINFMFMFFKNKKIKYIFLASMFFSLSVACRPTMLLVSLIFVIALFINYPIGKNTNKKEMLKLFSLTIIPYIIVGSLLMYYNYIRFDNIFEFGASYQLTLNDMSNLKNRFMTLGIGIMCNLFGLPTFSMEFPFISTNYNLLTFYGYYYVEAMLGGLFILVPICFSIFLIRKLYKKTKNKETYKFILLFASIGLLICIVSTITAGSVPRYIADYAWILIIAGIMAFLELWNIYNIREIKNMLYKIITILAVYTVIINFCGGIISEKSWFKENSPEEYYKIEYAINFWK